jgi:CrcB protein
MILAIALGSALGGVARYLFASWIQLRFGTTFPWGTLAVNLSGSFLLGLLAALALASTGLSPEIRALLTTGFCGGYTTFSTFSAETVRLVQDGDWRRAGLYVTASVVLALAATIAGAATAKGVLGIGRSA